MIQGSFGMLLVNNESEARVALVIIRNLLELTGNQIAEERASEYIEQVRKFDRNNGRAGKWFPTYSGWRYWPEDPRPGDFNVHDIANALAGTCRFNAHADEHYSVAQHCVLMSERAPGFEFLALMHDAPEAYLHDIATPVKRLLGPRYSVLTDMCWHAMVRQFGVDDGDELQPLLKALDLQFLHTEARDIFPLRMLADGETWGGSCVPNFSIKQCWSKEFAKERFLERFRQYCPGEPSL